MSEFKETDLAFHLPIEESAMQAYLQRYPAAIGPDDAMNRRGRAMTVQLMAKRPDRAPVAPTRLSPEETAMPNEVLARVQALMDEAGIPQEARASMIDDFAWEANLLPKGCKDILAIGCGDGIELFFLRAAMPGANLTALDYSDKMTPELKKAVNLRFIGGDMKTILEEMEDKFDLAFSNHTLEHLYMPDQILATVCGLLREGGALLSTMPMDAVAGAPFSDKILGIVEQKQVHPVDFTLLDTGHPWKTCPSDIKATMEGAGFKKVELYQRQEHLSRYFEGPEEQFHKDKERGLRLNALVFGLLRRVVKLLFPRNPPAIVPRLVFAAERRVWFGVNTLKNKFSQEACIVAYK